MIGLTYGSGGVIPVPNVQANALFAIASTAARLSGPISASPAGRLSAPAVAPRPASSAVPVSVVEPLQIAATEFSPAAAGVSVGLAKTIVPYDLAYEDIARSTAEDLADLGADYEQTRRQGKGWYRVSVLAAGVGLCIVAVAVIALVLGHVTTGIVTTVSTVLPNAVAGMFLVQSKRADDRVDAVVKQLNEAREWTGRLQIIRTIEDGHLRDELKAEMVRKRIAKS